MKEVIISPHNLKRTFICCNNPKSSSYNKKRRTYRWLNKIYKAKREDEIPPVIAVYDPETEDFLIYDGNIRTSYALLKGYKLKAKIIYNQQDLDEYLKNNSYLWWGIDNLKELLEFMRIYAQYPEEWQKMPLEFQVKVIKKYREWNEKKWIGMYDDEDYSNFPSF
ncbi:MAG TPA: hypothetical protein PLU00_02110 [Candidatus Pacearchaeota archaeon]|nr:hypothetical protein [Candidatus Pacearchaeota archaeon]HOL90577.1 hypothetical protein [Candidatus Pacearchaeota archaeon]